MGLPLPKHRFTLDDYLAWEQGQPLRHEYVAGEVFAMSGGSKRHNRIAGNLYLAICRQLDGRPCDTFINDVKLRVARTDACYYPDLMVHCRAEDAARDDEALIVEDPVLIVEVLSPTTEATDRREKARAFRQIDALREYVFVAQDWQWVEVFRRADDIGWLHIVHGAGESVELASIGLSLPVAEIYAGTDTPAQASAATDEGEARR